MGLLVDSMKNCLENRFQPYFLVHNYNYSLHHLCLNVDCGVLLHQCKLYLLLLSISMCHLCQGSCSFFDDNCYPESTEQCSIQATLDWMPSLTQQIEMNQIFSWDFECTHWLPVKMNWIFYHVYFQSEIFDYFNEKSPVQTKTNKNPLTFIASL